MPRFYCNVYDGDSLLDTVGVELPDRDVARVEAIRFAGAILRETAHRIAQGGDWLVEVSDDQDMPLLRLSFSVDIAPAPHGGDPDHSLAAIRTPWWTRPLAPTT